MAQWILVCGSYRRAEKLAADTLAPLIRKHTDPRLPVGIYEAAALDRALLSSNHAVFLGVGSSNPDAPHESAVPEEYALTVEPSPDAPALTRITITGSDAGGLLYGVTDFIGRYLPEAEYAGRHQKPYYLRPLFGDRMPDCRLRSSPAIPNRGLWTWGHVIWDYRGFLDNMVRAKLNTLVIWNRALPTNIREIIAYAHERAVKVVLGYAWGWGTDNSYESVMKILAGEEEIVREYFRDYAPLGADGIYFQSFTETSSETAGNLVIAEAVTGYVNRIAGAILERQPELLLQFGLHATSVREKLTYIRQVDPRITIVWEDCGAFPFAYTPDRVAGFEETLALTGEIAELRGEKERFGAVLKGLCCLSWDEFRAPERPSVLGESDSGFLRRRTEEKRRIWKYVQAYWLKNAEYARRTVALMARNPNPTVLALVEDGMFECEPWFPVMLLGEMLWNPETPSDELIRRVAASPNAVFA